MKRIDSHSFNNEVLAEISKIKIALTKITPENVKYFDDELLRKARGVVNYPDEYKWGGGSTINGISCKTIKRLTDFLKMSAFEIVLIDDMSDLHTAYFAWETYEVAQDYRYVKTHIEYAVPEGFDGRNSFFKIISRHSLNTFASDPNSVRELPYRYQWKSNVQNDMNRDKTIVSRTKSKIIVDISSYADRAAGSKTVIKTKILCFCWRKK